MNRYYNVKPRYSGGSPAMVDFTTATGVVDDERRSYDYALSGAYGNDREALARTAGLGGIVEDVTERADCWLITDMLTGDQFIRMFPADRQQSAVKQANKEQRLRRKYNLEVRA